MIGRNGRRGRERGEDADTPQPCYVLGVDALRPRRHPTNQPNELPPSHRSPRWRKSATYQFSILIALRMLHRDAPMLARAASGQRRPSTPSFRDLKSLSAVPQFPAMSWMDRTAWAARLVDLPVVLP